MKDVDEYAGGDLLEHSKTPIPKWLKWSYWILPVVGLIWLWYFWGGSRGWLDRGHWYGLEEAARTTFPLEEVTPSDPAANSS